MAEEGYMVMTTWETGAQIGWWVQVGRHELGDGLVSDWYPEYETQERREDGRDLRRLWFHTTSILMAIFSSGCHVLIPIRSSFIASYGRT
jgi:hypothetical protein